MNGKLALCITGVAVIIAVTYFGYDTIQDKVVECRSEVSKYVIAEYSEYSFMNEEWDYWSESASAIHTAITVDGYIRASNSDIKFNHSDGVYYPTMPIRDESMSKDKGFDSFKNHIDTKLTVVMSKMEFNEPISKTPRCFTNLGKIISVKTWYGISYGF